MHGYAERQIFKVKLELFTRHIVALYHFQPFANTINNKHIGPAMDILMTLVYRGFK